MDNTIIVLVVLAILVIALLRVKKHFKGGCCSSGSNTIRVKKELTEPEIGRKVMIIEGMTCENCQARVENVINRMDGAVCLVDLKKKTATVRLSSEVSDQALKTAVEKLGYKVREIL